MLDADEKFFKQNGIPLFSSHMIDLVWCPLSETSLFKIKLTNNSPVRRTDPLQLLPWHRLHQPLLTKHPRSRAALIPLLEESVDENISTCVAYLKRMAPMKQWLEMEIGITVCNTTQQTLALEES